MQQLHFRPDTGELRVYNDTMCVDAGGGRNQNGDPIVIWPCDGWPQQQWRLTPNGQVVGIGGKCLDITAWGSGNGATLQLWQCTGGANQTWLAW
jgi:hypothetical protein